MHKLHRIQAQSSAPKVLPLGLLFLLSAGSLSACSANLERNGSADDTNGPDDGTTNSVINEEYRGTFELQDPLVRRLTRDELRFTLEDSFDISLSEADMARVPADRPLEGFVNIATSQTVLPEHVEAYSQLADLVAERAANEGALARLIDCESLEADCRDEVVAQLGSLLFRRPLTESESTAFEELFDTVGNEEGSDFASAEGAVLRALLQSPQFLYRVENETAASRGVAAGEASTITGYEIATRLSYLLWASAPDASLLRDAEEGRLDTAEGIAEVVGEMLQELDKAKRVTSRYMLDWGRMEALPEEGGLKPEFIESLIATYNNMLWQENVGPLSALTNNQLIMTGSLAEGYGLEKTADGLATYDVTGLPGRVGLLTHPGLIAGMTNADGGAIVARGLFLQSQLFCQETPEPPTAVQEAIDEFLLEQSDTASDREIAEKRLMRNECAACHSGFDPLAYGLEQFDYQGRYRLMDEHGNDLSTDGWIPSHVRVDGDDVTYTSLEELAAALAQEAAVSRCVTAQHLKYALGRVLDESAEEAVIQVSAGFDSRGGSYPAMVETIASHPIFRTMKAE